VSTYDLWGYKSQTESKNYIIVGYSLRVNDDEEYYLDVIDVSEPASPSRVFTFENLTVYDIKSWDNYIYTVTGSHGSSTATIIDMEDPEQPQIVGTFPSAHNIFIDNRGYLYSTEDSFTIYSLNDDPTNPSDIYQGPDAHIHDIFVRDDIAYTFEGRNTAKVTMYDVSNPGDPEVINTISSPDIYFSHSGWSTPDNDYLIVADEYAVDDEMDFSIWDLTTDSPQQIYGFRDPNATAHNVMINGDYAFFSYYSAGFRVFDVSEPEDPDLIGEVDTNPYDGETVERTGNSVSIKLNGAWGIYALMDDGYVYLSDLTGLHVIEFEE
jgi:choice-of-anchor B domain-containing protein